MSDPSTSLSTLHGVNFFERLESILKLEMYSDIVVRVVDRISGESREFKAHKCILAASSPIWEASIKWLKGDVLTITGLRKSTAETLITYAYSNRLEVDSLANCFDIMTAADYHIMPKLIGECANYIGKSMFYEHVSIKKFIYIFNKASAFNIETLIDVCLDFLEYNSWEIFDSQDFLNLSQDSIVAMVVKDKYYFSEFRLIKAVIRWINANVVDKSPRDFLIDSGIFKSLKYKNLDHFEALAIFHENPSVYNENERAIILNAIIHELSLPPDFINSNNRLHRGNENIETDDELIVARPPVLIKEDFVYHGDRIDFPVISVTLEPRLSSHRTCFEYSGDSLILNFNGSVTDYNGVIDGSVGTVVKFPTVTRMPFENMDTFNISVILKRPGVYKKNCHFINDRGFFRIKKGLVRDINDTKKT